MNREDERSEVARLREALQHALSVIENYEMDIRNSDWTGVDLAAVGFCQGQIYRMARPQIRRMASIQSIEDNRLAPDGGSWEKLKPVSPKVARRWPPLSIESTLSGT